ncbi:MAG: alkaline phosphatase D family protein [Thiohalocapsa sp.]
MLALPAAVFVLGRIAPARAFSGNPFALGVASGNPGPDRVVLWTRLAPEPLSPDPDRPGGMPVEPVPVAWEIATDRQMTQVVRNSSIEAMPQTAHAVHVECVGLEPGRDYWYRFLAGGEASPVGRTRTAPAAGGRLDRLRFGFASCSNYEFGYFSAYRHLAEEHPDLVLFLGDYIYEYVAPAKKKVRVHSDGVEVTDLRTYRNRYAQYRTDPDLQQLHAAAPCLMTWDDHEVQNDYADRWSQDFADPQAFLARRAAAYRAFWEHMPLPLSAMPQGPKAMIHGRHDFGDLTSFYVVDGRQYRSRLACDRPPKGGGKQLTDVDCPERLDPARSYLGMAQEEWLYGQFRRPTAKWNILAQEQLMADLKERLKDGRIAHWSEDWNGFPAARGRLLGQLHETRLANPVVIGGDIHSFWANDLKLDFDDPHSATVGSEFVCTSITSPGPPYDMFAAWLPDNPHVKFFDSRKRGYVSAELQPQRLSVAFRAVSDVTDPKADVMTLQRFVVEDGKPGPVPA